MGEREMISCRLFMRKKGQGKSTGVMCMGSAGLWMWNREHGRCGV